MQNCLMKHILFLFIFFFQSLAAQDILLHSHNDYLQKKPLETALQYKANSIEVDVAWYKTTIKVSHLNFALKGKPLLEALYLQKMLAQKEHLSSVKFLMIDIKSGGEEILYALNNMISEYDEIFASRADLNSNKIKVVISGRANRQALVENKQLNFLFADGNPGDLDADIDSWLMPFVSANFTSMTVEERVSFIKKAHQQAKLVRFWNTKDNFTSWEGLLNLEVDIIGVDHLKMFRSFLALGN